jgi:hypothetical protein
MCGPNSFEDDNTFDIMFDDLNPEAQKAFLEFYGLKNAKDGNFDVFPIATLYGDEDDDGDGCGGGGCDGCCDCN